MALGTAGFADVRSRFGLQRMFGAVVPDWANAVAASARSPSCMRARLKSQAASRSGPASSMVPRTSRASAGRPAWNRLRANSFCVLNGSDGTSRMVGSRSRARRSARRRRPGHYPPRIIPSRRSARASQPGRRTAARRPEPPRDPRPLERGQGQQVERLGVIGVGTSAGQHLLGLDRLSGEVPAQAQHAVVLGLQVGAQGVVDRPRQRGCCPGGPPPAPGDATPCGRPSRSRAAAGPTGRLRSNRLGRRPRLREPPGPGPARTIPTTGPRHPGSPPGRGPSTRFAAVASQGAPESWSPSRVCPPPGTVLGDHQRVTAVVRPWSQVPFVSYRAIRSQSHDPPFERPGGYFTIAVRDAEPGGRWTRM